MIAHTLASKAKRLAGFTLLMLSSARCGSSESVDEFSSLEPEDASVGVDQNDASQDGTANDGQTDGVDGRSNDSGVDGSTDTGTGEPSIPPWRFAVVGDSRTDSVLDLDGVNDEVWGGLVAKIIEEQAEFVLFPGDLTQIGRLFQLRHWISIAQPLYDAGIKVYAVRGNHDAAPLLQWTWNDAFGGEYRLPDNGPSSEENLTYSFAHKNVFVAAIDNYGQSNKVNQAWLDSQLAANTKPHVFAFGHEPAFAADHSDTLDDQPNQRNRFWESLKAVGARAYFCGHDHFYDHARIDDGDGNHDNDLHQFIVGTAGAPLYDFGGDYVGNNGPYTPKQEFSCDQYGYSIVEVDGMDVTITFMERVGDVYEPKDSFSYTVTP